MALVVPEYRTDAGGNGGVSAVADFVAEAVARAPDMEATLVSPRMSRRAEESRRAALPSTWLTRPVARRRTVGSHEVTYVGSSIAEWEPARYLPRRALDRTLRDADRVVVIAGSPAIGLSTRRIQAPVLLQVATWIHWERKARLEQQRGWRRVAMGLNTKVTSWLDQRALTAADGILVENQAMLDSIEGLLPGKVALLPPGVDADFFAPAPGPLTLGDHIAMVGRLADPRKNLENLVRAYAIARGLGVELPLVMAGRGKPPELVYSLISDLNLTDFVRIESDVSAERLREIHRSSRVFCLASREEGLGIAILEAMACGVPVVSTATEGARMILGDAVEVGELVPIGDCEALGAALARAATRDLDEHTIHAKAARRHVVNHYSLESSGKRFVDTIRSGSVAAFPGTRGGQGSPSLRRRLP